MSSSNVVRFRGRSSEERMSDDKGGRRRRVIRLGRFVEN